VSHRPLLSYASQQTITDLIQERVAARIEDLLDSHESASQGLICKTRTSYRISKSWITALAEAQSEARRCHDGAQ